MKKLIETTPAVPFLTCLLFVQQAVAQTDVTPTTVRSNPAIGINPKVSDSGFVDGLCQFNGLEINLLQRKNSRTCFFFGVGPAFINAFAEKIEGQPRYGRGMHFINGLRVYIGK